MSAAANGRVTSYAAAVAGGKPSGGKSSGGKSSGGKRSRSPETAAGPPTRPLPQGHRVQFFYEVDAGDKKAALVRPSVPAAQGYGLLQSHGWLEGTLHEAYDPSALDASDESTWPKVVPRQDVCFMERSGKKLKGASVAEPRRVFQVREPTSRAPLLSVVLVRWGGEYSAWMDEPEANDGDWGKFGSPPSDEYMKAMVEIGIMGHPRLLNDDGYSSNVEIFHLFIRSSEDCWRLMPNAKTIRSALKGKHVTAFWMLWPAEWLDTGDPDFACYVERQAMFGAMRACEAASLRSGFPHLADQFEIITSKSWMATLALHPKAHLPAATLVCKGSVVASPKVAAKQALAALEHTRRLNPFPVGASEPAAPSEINKDGVRKGVVKLGWSWENRFVLIFKGEEQLAARLKEMMSQPGCTSSQCVVQEWVDFDFEMRLYFLPAGDWTAGQHLAPTRVECNAWGPRDENSGVGSSGASFHKVSKESALQRWSGDEAAWESANAQAVEIGQFLLAWLLSTSAQPVAMIRMDFMLKRVGPGKVRVFFGEYCEMGACCLGWTEGPPTIWRAALDAAMK